MPSADAGAVHSSASQNLHPRPEGDNSEWFGEHRSLFEEHSNSIWCNSQTKDERKRNGQKRAAMSHISGYGFEHLSGDA